jgi:hypothetical protein
LRLSSNADSGAALPANLKPWPFLGRLELEVSDGRADDPSRSEAGTVLSMAVLGLEVDHQMVRAASSLSTTSL